MFGKLRSNFISGLFIVLPTVATIWILKFSVELLSGPVQVLLPKRSPLLLSFVLSVAFISLVGVFARLFFGQAVLGWFERLISRIPFLGRVYSSMVQLIKAFSFKDKGLLGTVLVEYPRKGIYALGFITNNDVSGLKTKEGVDIGVGKCSVFVPTTPNPTSGYFIYVNRDELVYLDVSVEESIKTLISAGVV